MAFAVAAAEKIADSVWENFWAFGEDNFAVRNWLWDSINYLHSQKVDMFGAGTAQASGPNATAWVA